MPKFVRPPSLRFPQIYGAFKSKDKDSDDIVDYVIQDLPEEYFDEALDLLINDHLPDETLHLCRGVADIEEAISEAREDWRKKLNFRLSIACFRSDGEDDELVGVNVLAVASKDDEIDENVIKKIIFIKLINEKKFFSHKIPHMLTSFKLIITSQCNTMSSKHIMLINISQTMDLSLIVIIDSAELLANFLKLVLWFCEFLN